MLKFLFYLSSAATLLLFNAGCTAMQCDKAETAWTFPGELNTKYYVGYVMENSQKLDAPTGEDRPYIMFRSADDAKSQEKTLRINGMAGDNLFFGGVVVTGNKVNIDKVGVTRRAGPNFKFEQAFLTALNQIDNITCEKKQLKLYSGKNLLIYGDAN